MTQKSDNIPTRKQLNETSDAEKPARSLAGKYRVRDGYNIAHGAHDQEGRHSIAKGGEIVDLSHDEALSVIKLTKDQKNADGTANGPAIETEASYNARVAAQREHEEFMKSLSDQNNFPTT